MSWRQNFLQAGVPFKSTSAKVKAAIHLTEQILINSPHFDERPSLDDVLVARKFGVALAAGLVPILCVGETLEDYEANRTYDVVFRQVNLGLNGIEFELGESNVPNLVIAYEPIWAIGTGRAATPQDANRVIAEVVRTALAELYGDNIAQKIRVLYGGSVNGENAKDFFVQSEIDGALVGGASLKATEFIQITNAAAT